MIPPRFAMTDHDEMTGCTAWEPAPRYTHGEVQVAAEACAASLTPMARVVSAGLAALGSAVHGMAAAMLKAQQEAAADYRLVR